jgi:Phosphodiester glycosidase
MFDRHIIIAGCALLLGGCTVFAQAKPKLNNQPSVTSNISIPTGYQPIFNSSGVRVFKNADRADYITSIDLKQSTAINLTGNYTDAPQGKVSHRSMSEFWQDAIAKNTPQQQAQVVINGAFFAQYKKATAIAFGLKSAGTVISYGYGLEEFPGLNKTIAWNNTTKQVKIADYDRLTFNQSAFPEVVGALAETAGKRANRPLSRTFIGVKDSTLLVFSSKAARQIDAVNALKSFGATQVAMLDGGGSTGLVVKGQKLIDTGTSVPHAIGFYSK